jgi:hypothetical protein
MSFFGGAKEPQDQSMRESMQRESAEELVLISKHGRPLCDTLVLMCHRALDMRFSQAGRWRCQLAAAPAVAGANRIGPAAKRTHERSIGLRYTLPFIL